MGENVSGTKERERDARAAGRFCRERDLFLSRREREYATPSVILSQMTGKFQRCPRTVHPTCVLYAPSPDGARKKMADSDDAFAQESGRTVRERETRITRGEVGEGKNR